MNIKLQIGRAINAGIEKLITVRHTMVPFIPNGRFVALDIKRAGIPIETVFDVGANTGQTANYLSKHFPFAAIHSFEPVEATYKQLVTNIKSELIKTHNIGLGERAEKLVIHKNNSSGSSSLKGNDGRFFSTETVSINTGQDFCRDNNIGVIDLLKMDVEGHELAVLIGFDDILETSVKMIYTEIGFDINDPYKTYMGDLLNILTPKGFIVSGFYEPYRWGKGDLRVFYNVLLVNTTLLNV